MLVILTCFETCEPFGVLTKQRPVAMLPVLNKPIMEHLVERCADAGLTQVHVALVEHPRPVRDFLRGGSRWGLEVHTWNFREPCSDQELIAGLARDYEGPVLLIPAETVIDLDLKALMAFHQRGAQGVSRVFGRGESERQDRSVSRTGLLELPVRDYSGDTGIRIVDVPMNPHATVETFVCEGNWMKVSSPALLWEANTRAVYGEFPHLLPSAAGSEPRQWFGHHCRIDPRSSLETPVFMGNHTSIGSGVRIKAGSVIGNGVIIDSDATVHASVILDHTYVGSNTEVVERIVSGKYVLNVKTGFTLRVDDPIIVSGLREKILGPAARRLTDKLMALILFLATSPVWGTKGLLRLLKGRPFFDTRTCIVTDGGDRGAVMPSSSRVSLLGFHDANALVARLPGLWDVINGRLALVGIRPLSEGEMDRMGEDWAMLRFEAPEGLFTMLDTLGSDDLVEDERLVIENYYASTRKLTSDVKILCKSLPKLILARRVHAS